MNKVLTKFVRIARLLAKGDRPLLLSTIGINGAPRSRYIGEFRIRDTGEFFLICLSNSNKIREIRKNPLAQLIFSSKDFQRVLTLSGNAALLEDITLRQELFDEKKPLKLYPVFNDNFGVIHFVPVQAEYLDLNVSNDPVVINIPRD